MTSKPAVQLKFKEDVPASKPKRPSIGTEALAAKCGHTITFELYARDPFRVARREKFAARDCSACRQARAQAEMNRAAERVAKKVATMKPRLPNEARFTATYDAAAVRWTGSLTIEGVMFERSAGSLKKLLHKLDDAYRASLLPPSETEPEQPGVS